MRQPRLLEQFVPSTYKLNIKISQDQQSFSGSVQITGNILSTQNHVDLHAVNLEISSVVVQGQDATVHTVPEQQKIRLELEKEISGEIEIKIEFSSKITETMEGIYPSDYIEGGIKKKLISTQFESHHAREAFPCIDEPAAKAIFELTLNTTDNDDIILANTPIVKQINSDEIKSTTFAPTPKMSPYLLAFVIGDLDQKTAKTKSGIEVRTFAQPSHIESTRFALETAVRTLDFFEEYFEIPYPLEKCDLVAVPQFAAGAMENWGLITFRESTLLVDKNHSSLINQQEVALTVAHELAHQWFGNLVTMQWWDDLWLNEGFASWIMYLAPAKLFPDWEMWTQFVADDYLFALRADALASSHPIEMIVDDPRDISEIFDHITYRKGASVIRQLHNYMGSDNFRRGLINYLKKHSYANATTKDLWQSLDEACNIDVAEFMTAWTTQTGYPVVSYNDETKTLSQQRFLIDPAQKNDDSIWPIVVSSDEKTDDSITFSTASWQSPNPIKLPLNPKRNGLYRVKYTKQQHAKLLNTACTAEDIMGQLNDSFELAKADHAPLVDAISLLPEVSKTENSAIWDIIATQLGDVNLALGSDQLREAKKPFIRSLIRDHYHRLGWEKDDNENYHDTILRPIIISLAIHSELDEAAQNADTYMNDYMNNETTIPADFRSSVYTRFVKKETTEAFDTLLEYHQNSNLAEERSRLTAALCSFETPELYNRAIELIISDKVQLQDVISWLANLLRNRHSREAAWQWYETNWDWIVKTFAGGHLYNYFPQFLGVFSEKNKMIEIRNFFANKDTTGIAMSLEQAIEKVSWRSALRKREYDNVLAFFQNFK